MSSEHRLLRVLRALVRRELPRFQGLFRYRVVTQAVDNRLTLQFAPLAKGKAKDNALPDTVAFSMVAGMAGLSAELTPGTLVLVQFIEGDPTAPIVTHYMGPGDPTFLPVSVALDAATTVRVGEHASHVIVGADAAPPKAVGRVGDAVDGGTLTGTVLVAAVPVPVQFIFTPPGGSPSSPGPTAALSGAIAGGSPLLSSG